MARLFEQSEETTPGDLTERLSYGKVASQTKNITWTNLVAWLNSVLGFLKISSNLDDLNNKATARTNLEVYSTTEIDDDLDLKADKTNVLEKDNTTAFTPTSSYHPATKSYVDNGGISIPWVDGNLEGSNHGSNSFIRCCRLGGVMYIHGDIQTISQPSEDDVLFSLPVAPYDFPNFSEDIHFSAAGAEPTENYELKLAAGTKNIVSGAGQSSDSTASFFLAIPIF